MTSQPEDRLPEPQVPRRLPLAATMTAGVLLAIPLVALALVGTYSSSTPKLWGFPFFYWYQFLWVFLASACTYLAHLVILRARRRGADR